MAKEKTKTRDSAIILAVIAVIGSLGVAYINGCFSSSKASPTNTHVVEQKFDSGAKNNSASIQQTNQENHVNGSQYNAARDIVINPVQTSTSKAQKTESKKEKIKKDSAKEPSLKVDENKGFVNVGGTNNTYNQSIHNEPQPRHITDPEISNFLNLFKNQIPVSSDIVVGGGLGDGESINLASEIMRKLKEWGYKVDGVNQNIYKTDLPKRDFILEKPTDTKIIINVMPLSYIKDNKESVY